MDLIYFSKDEKTQMIIGWSYQSSSLSLNPDNIMILLDKVQTSPTNFLSLFDLENERKEVKSKHFVTEVVERNVRGRVRGEWNDTSTATYTPLTSAGNIQTLSLISRKREISAALCGANEGFGLWPKIFNAENHFEMYAQRRSTTYLCCYILG